MPTLPRRSLRMAFDTLDDYLLVLAIMSHTDLPEEAELELVRVSSDDERYILSDFEGAIAVGDRYAITRVLGASSHNLEPEEISALLDIADEMGGNTQRSAWGVGRYIYHIFTFGEDGIILGEAFSSFVNDIEGGRSIEDAGKDVTGNSDHNLVFNRARSHHLYSGMRRAGIPLPTLELMDFSRWSVGPLSPVLPLGTLNRDFQASLIDIGKDIVDDIGSVYEEEEDRHYDILCWGAASSFLLADVMLEEMFYDHASAVRAARRILDEYIDLDVYDLRRVFASRLSDSIGSDDIRALLRRSETKDRHATKLVAELIRKGYGTDDIGAMLDAGLDVDLVEAVG